MMIVPLEDALAVVKSLVIVAACIGVGEFRAWCRYRERESRQRSGVT